MRMFTRIACLFALSVLLRNGLFAQNYFTAVSPAVTNQVAQAKVVQKVSKMGLFSLDQVAMQKHLLAAPLEFQNKGRFVPLQIPLPDGTVETFNMVESPVLSPKIAAENPDIKTYTGNGTTDKTRIIRLSLTPSGFNAIILNVNGDAVYFEAYSASQPNLYYNYFTKDVIVPKGAPRSSGTDMIDIPKENLPAAKQTSGISTTSGTSGAVTNSFPTGSTLTIFRLALAADGYFFAEHGSTKASAFATLVGYVNRVNAMYRNELSVGFTLVSGQNLVYPDSATDPYTSENEGIMLGQNQVVMDDSIGTANYDIGHVFSYRSNLSGAGLAYTPSLCNNTYKAGGTSQEADPTFFSQQNNDKLVFHEIGHQFSMTHSYNSFQGVCQTRNPATTVEPGSGATCMSYAMICFNGFSGYDAYGDDYYNIEPTPVDRGALLQFHTVNYQQAVNYMQSISSPYPTGVVVTATANTPPVVTMPAKYTIPKSTPFALTGTATDVNAADVLTYCWEGTNLGDQNTEPDITVLGDPSKGPFSRTYTPASTGTRYFPILDSILNGNNLARADKLASVSTVLTYNMTVRDNNAAGGGVTFGSDTITVDGSMGPFLVTNDPNGSFSGLAPMTVTWSVNNTLLSTPLVNILLSTDGGLTFPTSLVANAPNLGTAAVVLPNVSTTTARIKVAAANNIFFDISNNNFTISAILPVTLTSFTATLQNKKDALLTWQTATETNSKGYEIEMAEGSPAAFADISFVASKGITSTVSNYSFIASNLAPGVYYFRLRMIDIDGSFTYSGVQTVTVIGNNGLISIYPTPVRNQLTVVLSSEMQNAQLQLVNSLGQIISVNATTNGSTRLLSMGNLPAGIYLLKVMNGTNLVTTKKVVKE